MKTKESDLVDRVEIIISQISLPENFSIVFSKDKTVENGRYYVQIECERVDTFTGELGVGRGGKAYLSQYSTNSEIIQIIFGLYKSYWEHEARETFLWRGRRVFGPHISTEALWEVAERYDARDNETYGLD